MDGGLTFDGVTHLPIVVPGSSAELGELVRRAVADRQALYPFGGRTMLDLGLIPTKPGVGVDLRKLNQLVDYPARDMTITVQAGITIAQLRETLEAENQRLAVDVPLPEQATLGGAIAANASGPRRFGFGTLRDYVIGISAINDRGEEIKGGGRVVKNVAGYDLMKLYTGSLGTLGIISQATLKLKPRPEAARLLILPLSIEQVGAILDALNVSRTRPTCIDLLDPAAATVVCARAGLDIITGSVWPLIVGFEDNFKSVGWQIEQFARELPAEQRRLLRECTGDEQRRLLPALTDFALYPEARLSIKANVRPSAVPSFVDSAASQKPAPLLQAHAGNGIIHGHWPQLTFEQAASAIESLGLRAAQAEGNLIVSRCPAEWKVKLPIWGRATPAGMLMKAIKEKLDPAGIFNPGRFVDGI